MPSSAQVKLLFNRYNMMESVLIPIVRHIHNPDWIRDTYFWLFPDEQFYAIMVSRFFDGLSICKERLSSIEILYDFTYHLARKASRNER